jgi:Xaa-Pro dipeptidase
MNTSLDALYGEHFQTLCRRHDEALEATGFDQVAIYAGGEKAQFLDDQPYPFKANPLFKAWLPLADAPESFLLYRPGETPALIVYRPTDFWYLPPEPPAGFWVEHYDIRTIERPEEVREHLRHRSGRTAFLGEWHGRFADWPFAEANPQRLIDYLHYQRAYKTDYELECLRQANARGVQGHLAAARTFRDGGAEFDILQAFCQGCRQTEVELPYPAIVALNEHGATLHYQYAERAVPAATHAFLIDAGASCNGYAADITRGYARDDADFKTLIDAVDAAQQRLGRAVKPGVDYREIHRLAHAEVARILAEQDFVKLAPETIVETGISRSFFPHGIGHFLGLQVHDVGGFLADPHGRRIDPPAEHPALRLTRVLEPREVVTIEPGIYFIGSLLARLKESEHGRQINWSKIEAFGKFGGVRIEDDIAVTEDEPENLTRPQFAALR